MPLGLAMLLGGSALLGQPNANSGPPAALGPPIPGYWQGWGHYIPCSLTIPYNEWTEPGTGYTLVMQYPVTVWQVFPPPHAACGTGAGQGGSDHTTQVMCDGAPIPLRSGLCDVNPLTCPIYGAPYRDAPAFQPGGKTLCEKYTDLNPPGRAKPCPSNQTKQQYGQTIAQSIQWIGNWQANQAERLAQCNAPAPTRTPTPSPTKTPSPTPIAVNPYAAWIEKLYQDGITAGCGPTTYCPKNPVTREQMAVFLLRIIYGANYQPPPCVGIFTDVPCGSPTPLPVP